MALLAGERLAAFFGLLLLAEEGSPLLLRLAEEPLLFLAVAFLGAAFFGLAFFAPPFLGAAFFAEDLEDAFLAPPFFAPADQHD